MQEEVLQRLQAEENERENSVHIRTGQRVQHEDINPPALQMMKIIGKTKLPENPTIEGSITQHDTKLIIEHSSQGIIQGCKLVMQLTVVVLLNGVEVEFKSEISHSFTDFEFNGFMVHNKLTNNGKEKERTERP